MDETKLKRIIDKIESKQNHEKKSVYFWPS